MFDKAAFLRQNADQFPNFRLATRADIRPSGLLHVIDVPREHDGQATRFEYPPLVFLDIWPLRKSRRSGGAGGKRVCLRISGGIKWQFVPLEDVVGTTCEPKTHGHYKARIYVVEYR